jgi:hypothetical protein
MANFPVTQEQPENYLRENRFITADTIERHLQEMRYITNADMRSFVSNELKTEHDALEARLTSSVQAAKDGVQAVHDKVVQDQASFEARVSAANDTFDASNATTQQRQAELAAGFAQSEATLREHLDASQRASNEGLESMQRTLGDLLVANRLEIDQKMALVHQELQTAACGLYSEALQAAQSAQTGGGGGGGDHGGKGSGGPRERSLYDLRDYKLADLASDPTLATFKKWRHDLDLFLETIGVSWRGVTALMRTSRLYTEVFSGERVQEIEALRRKTEPAAPSST